MVAWLARVRHRPGRLPGRGYHHARRQCDGRLALPYMHPPIALLDGSYTSHCRSHVRHKRAAASGDFGAVPCPALTTCVPATTAAATLAAVAG